MPSRDCRAWCAVLVDGAHAVGALDLDVPSLGAQFYTANLHKWLCTPKGTAFLWVHPAEQASIRPLVTSHGCGQVSQLQGSACALSPLVGLHHSF